jgi:hypothetical protein
VVLLKWQQPNDRANVYNQRKNNAFAMAKAPIKAIIKELTDRLLLVCPETQKTLKTFKI